MPSKYTIKEMTPGGIYHVYNRGVEKRNIFIDDSDYRYFLWLLKTYLSCPQGSLPGQGETLAGRPNFFEEIELLSYCLMPNHFHLLIKQKDQNSMPRFMKCLATNYSMHFNNRYKRIGTLFQGPYKAILVKDDAYLLHLSRYIHLNPVASKGSLPGQGETLTGAWSSYGDFLKSKNSKWVKPNVILDLMNQGIGAFGDRVNSYKEFVEDYHGDSLEILGGLVIDNEEN